MNELELEIERDAWKDKLLWTWRLMIY
jgi:hypothetical protein